MPRMPLAAKFCQVAWVVNDICVVERFFLKTMKKVSRFLLAQIRATLSCVAARTVEVNAHDTFGRHKTAI